jgi:hypothetical protein
MQQITGLWERTTPDAQVRNADLLFNDKLEFLKDGTIIFSPTSASGTYSFSKDNRITINVGRGALTFKVSLSESTLQLIDVDGYAVDYMRIR